MARKPRIEAPDTIYHVRAIGNQRRFVFIDDADYIDYLANIKYYLEKFDFKVYAYMLMTNHVHLLLTPQVDGAAGVVMKRLGQRYVQYVNRRRKRSGTLWEGRFRSSLIAEDRYLLACHRYIELNPVCAGMVRAPGDYPWSSYRANALGAQRHGLRPHATYLALGNDDAQRQSAYRGLFSDSLAPNLVADIRNANRSHSAIGSTHRLQPVQPGSDPCG